MWEVENETPFAADRAWVRDRDGAEVWLVAVKCTFAVGADGSLGVAEDQPPVLHAPAYHGQPGRSSLLYGADLVLTKRTTDVIVVGHAYAPGGRPARSIDCELSIGPVRKRLAIIGDRVWKGLSATEPVPFQRMAVTYERAFGGRDRKSPQPDRDWDARNPAGTGFAATKDAAVGMALPNVEYPEDRVGKWNDRPTPAGFGALDAHWQPRARWAGTYDDDWLQHRHPLLPLDFDERFFQLAPDDQQSPTFLRGGEAVWIRNMTPEGVLRFELPKIFLGFETHFYDGSFELHQKRRLHTVIIEPDLRRVSLVWHSALHCHSKVQKLDRTVVTLKTLREGAGAETLAGVPGA
jgi:hypothetical protein